MISARSYGLLLLALVSGAVILLNGPKAGHDAPEPARSRQVTSASISTTTTRLLASASPPYLGPAMDERKLPERSTTTTSPPPTGPTTVAGGGQPTQLGNAGGSLSRPYADQFAVEINALRADAGLDPLVRDESLDGEAEGWAQTIGVSGELAHSSLGRLIPPWSAVAENIGSGGTVPSLFSALASSPGHLSNMIGDYTHLGVGVWVDPAGTIWVVQLFTR